MFNETLLPYVKSMNNNLRKEWLDNLQDFENKTIDISISSDNINPGGLFCLVDFLDSKKAYIFIINEVSKHEKKITANLKNCTKPFFSYLRSKRKVNTTVTSLVREDGSETKGAGEAASELSAFFSSVFEQECYGPLKKECYDKVPGYSEISDFTINRNPSMMLKSC